MQKNVKVLKDVFPAHKVLEAGMSAKVHVNELSNMHLRRMVDVLNDPVKFGKVDFTVKRSGTGLTIIAE